MSESTFRLYSVHGIELLRRVRYSHFRDLVDLAEILNIVWSGRSASEGIRDPVAQDILVRILALVPVVGRQRLELADIYASEIHRAFINKEGDELGEYMAFNRLLQPIKRSSEKTIKLPSIDWRGDTLDALISLGMSYRDASACLDNEDSYAIQAILERSLSRALGGTPEDPVEPETIEEFQAAMEDPAVKESLAKAFPAHIAALF